MKTLFVVILALIGVLVPLGIVFIHAKFFAKQRVELSNDWTVFFKKWSTWLQITATGLQGWLLISPDEFLRLWNQLPDEWKSTIPASYTKLAPMVFIIASLVVSNIKQQKLARAQAALVAAGTSAAVPTVQPVANVQRSNRDWIGKP